MTKIYMHTNTGATVELIEENGATAKLKDRMTGDVKELSLATLKRWWREVEDEAIETAEPEEANEAIERTESEEANEDAALAGRLADDLEDTDEPEEANDTTKPEDAPDNPEIAPIKPEDQEPEETTPAESEATTQALNAQNDSSTPMSLSDIVKKLEDLFDILNRLYFDDNLPRPIITIQSTPKAYGHCSIRKIWNSGTEGEGDSYYEINIGAEYLNRTSEQTAATMLHEMIHL